MKDIDKALSNWNEYSSFKLKNIGNLSCSDLDTLKLYSRQYLANGGNSFSPYREPLGEVKQVLEAYNIKPKHNSLF